MAEDKDSEKKLITDEIATVEKDIDIFAGWIKRLENPDPTLRTESGGKGIKLYDEVDRDAHAGAVLQSRYMSVVGKDWEITPGKTGVQDGFPVSTDQDLAIADFVAEAIDNCARINQVRRELLQGILYGFYVAEVIWTRRPDGSVVPKRLIAKHPRRFVFTPARELRLLTPSSMIEGEEVPERKFMVFCYGDSDNPYGKGLGQKLWWWVWFKKNGVKFWLIFNEKFGMPTTVGKYPPGTGAPEQANLMAALESIQADTGIKIPENMKIEFLEATRNGKASYGEFCEYCDKQISKAVLSQTASTEGTPGKLGGDDAQDDVRQEIVEADADLLDEVFNETLVRWIVDLNFPGVTSYPLMDTHAAPKPDLTARSEIDRRLVKEIGLPVSRRYFYDTYNVPEPDEGEELVLSPETRQNGPGASGAIDALAGARNAQRGAEYAESAPRELTYQLDDAAGPLMDGMLDQVKDLVMAAGSLEEIRDGMLDLYPGMDPAKLGALMQQAFAVAELTGRSEVKEGD